MEKKINKKIDSLLKKMPCVGSSAVLFNDKEIIYKRHDGFINKAKELKTDDNSYFMIGSNTKVLTALGVFKLYEKGKLSLNDDIKKYLPEFKIKSVFEQETITIEHLLKHRSGIQCDLYDYILNDQCDYHDIIKALENTYLTNKPGAMFAYSNIGYTLLGIIIERITGLSYVEYIKENIAKPLGVDIHFINPKDKKGENFSLSYDKKLEEKIDPLATLLPAGSNTYMKITDLIKVGQMFLNGGIVDGNEFIKKDTLDLMLSFDLNQPLDKKISNVGYGIIHNSLNIEIEDKIIGHGGDTFYHHSYFMMIPGKNVGAVVFTNSESGEVLSQNIGNNLLYKYLEHNGVKLQKPSTKHKHVETNLDKYIGEYATIFGLMKFEFDTKGNLVTTVSGQKVKLIPCEDGYLQAYPICRWYKKPFLRVLKTLRFNLTEYSNEQVLAFEQVKGYKKIDLIIGVPYSANETETLWTSAVGQYEIVNLDNENFKGMALINEGDKLQVVVDLGLEKIIKYIKVYNDNVAFSQGFGRDCKEAIHLKEEDGYYYIYCSGVLGKKKND